MVNQMHRCQLVTLPLLLAVVASGCLNNTDGYFTAKLLNDLPEKIHFDACEPGGTDCHIRTDKQSDVEPGQSGTFVVGDGQSGSFRLSSDDGKVLGCIPWAFDDYLQDDGTIFKASQMVDCDQTEPIEPYKLADRVEGF